VGPGVFLYEVQQPSDLTYRCDDWGRPATPERPLHVAQALASVRPGSRPRLRHAQTADRATVIDEEHFLLEEVVVGPDRTARLEPGGASVHVVTALDGPIRLLAAAPDAPGAPGDRGTGSEPIVLGGLETAVVSAGVVAYTIDAPARARVLIARVP
jgi:mannose-6-phosphate isomerase